MVNRYGSKHRAPRERVIASRANTGRQRAARANEQAKRPIPTLLPLLLRTPLDRGAPLSSFSGVSSRQTVVDFVLTVVN